MILAGDIGGTKCNLAIFEESGRALKVVFQSRYATREFSSLEHLVREFMQQAASRQGRPHKSGVTAAAFGIPGTVVDGRLLAKNLDWSPDTRGLARTLNLRIEEIVLMNDLAAAACGLERLVPQDFLVISAGIPHPGGNKALIAPGTGLGEAILFWDGSSYIPSYSEGGAADFAPHNDRELQLLLFLRQEMPRVTCEDIFSGRGFRKIHEYLDQSVRHASFEDSGGDPAKEITQNALAETCAVCVKTVDNWIDAFAAEAGDLALSALATGGIYLAGGIILKILPKLKPDDFCRAFSNKATLTPLLARIPIRVVLNEDAPLWGAAYEALRRVHSHGRE